MAQPLALPIDWDKPHLRIAYLVEGVFRDTYGGRHVVRWCGPKDKTGSGLLARASVDGVAVHEDIPTDHLLEGHTHDTRYTTSQEAFQGRLSRCVFDKTLGTIKQNVQALSQITLTVDLGDDDLGPTAQLDVSALRDMAVHGRWRGQPVRFTLLDLDDPVHMETVAQGSWDRDPTDMTDRSFKMTIDVADALPPTLDWPAYQVPQKTDQWIEPGSGGMGLGSWPVTVPAAYYLNPDQKGKWLGQLYGGISVDSLYRELVIYGVDNTVWFALVSPRFDQFCFDVWYEKDGGGITQCSAIVSTIICFNNEDPRVGPLGTCVRFTTLGDFSPTGGARAFGKVAGGPHAISRPATYGPTFPYGANRLGDNLPAGAEAIPDVYGTDTKSKPQLVFEDMISTLLGTPQNLHPDAVQAIANFVLNYLPAGSDNRTCALPLRLTDEPISFRRAMQGFMQSIPADMIMKRDPSSQTYVRKFYAVPRQQPGDKATRTFTEADLMVSTPSIGTRHRSDPDGVYGNAVTVETSEYLDEPTSDQAEVSLTRVVELADLAEQSDTATGLVVEQKIPMLGWNFRDDATFEAVAGLLEAERSRPQPVLEAVHGYPSFRQELGDVIEYAIQGVYSGPGQIRSMRLDLDKQAVTVRSYHQPSVPKVVSVEGEVARKDKAMQVAEHKEPERDRSRFGQQRPGAYRAG